MLNYQRVSLRHSEDGFFSPCSMRIPKKFRLPTMPTSNENDVHGSGKSNLSCEWEFVNTLVPTGWLVVSIPLKNMSSSIGMILPNILGNWKSCSKPPSSWFLPPPKHLPKPRKNHHLLIISAGWDSDEASLSLQILQRCPGKKWTSATPSGGLDDFP